MSLRSCVSAAAGALAMLALTLPGCGSGMQAAPSANGYLQQLSAEQTKLAAAERRIPRRASSPAALAGAIALLAGAVGRLERDLAAISPPAAVKNLHARLVSIAHSYSSRLQAAARRARRPGGEPAAAQGLTSATSAASTEFTGTVAGIKSKLRGSS